MFNLTKLKNENNVTFQLDSFNDKTLQRILNSRFIRDSIYTLELIKEGEEIQTFFSAPSFDQNYNLSRIETNWIEFDESHCFYELAQTKPYFLPIQVDSLHDTITFLTNLDMEFLYVQVLVQKLKGNWRNRAIKLYEQYREGNDDVSYNPILRSAHGGFYKLINKLTNDKFKREPVEEIDRKILQDNFRFECRLVMKQFDRTAEIEQHFKNTILFNELKLVESEIDLVNYIQERSFKVEYENQILSHDEIMSLFSQATINAIKTNNTENKVSIISQDELETNHNPALQNIFELFPINERQGDDSINDEIINRLKHSFKRNKITNKQIQIVETFQGVTLNKITIKIPQDVVYSQIQKNLKNIQATMGDDNISCEIGSVPDTVNFLIPRQKRDVLYMRELIESTDFHEFRKENILPMVIGEDVNGSYLFLCLQKLKHLLVVGATGGGKSEFVNNLITCLLMFVSREMLKMILIDPKKVEFPIYNEFPQVEEVVTDMSYAVDILEELVGEMESRYDLFAKAGVRSIEQYHSKSKKKLPYIVCVIDEYADLMDTNSEVEEYIVRLGQMARAAGIHLIICTQKPLANIVTSRLKSNLPSVISFRMKTHSDYMTVFGKNIPYRLLGNGDGVAMIEGHSQEFIRFQSPIISPDNDERDMFINNLKESILNGNIVDEIVPVVEEENYKDKLKSYMLETGETRVAKLREYMGIGMNTLHELISELVEERFLEKQGKGYIIVNDGVD